MLSRPEWMRNRQGNQAVFGNYPRYHSILTKGVLFMRLGKIFAILASCVFALFALSGCANVGNGKQIVRVAHSQTEKHPEHTAIVAFKKYVEERLGDKYEIQIFPNELLGGQKKVIELNQTGAIDIVIVGAPNVETVEKTFEIFSIPYLFGSKEAYFATMNDPSITEKIYKTPEHAGFRVVTWYNAGLRSFYAKTPINTPDDMKGLKLRVQQSPASIAMVNALGGAATPMAFGEVYTAIQQGVIDGAENNELALTANKHGEVAKFYSNNMHQMIPDIVLANVRFLEALPEADRKVFMDGFKYSTEVELVEWEKQVEEAKKYAIEQQKVTFLNVDMSKFREKMLPLQDEIVKNNPSIKEYYDYIQKVNDKVEKEKKEAK